MDFLTALKQAGTINDEQVTQITALLEQGSSIESAMLKAGVAPEVVRTTMAEYYGIPAFEPPKDIQISQDLLGFLPEGSAQHYQMIPIALVDGVLEVAVNNPDNAQIKEVLNFISSQKNQPYKMVYVLPADLDHLLRSYASLAGEVDQALSSLETELDTEIAARQREADGDTSEADHIEEDAPVTKIVATLLRYAVDGLASDIHVEPYVDKVRVRFRVDGKLQTSLQLPKNVQSAVVARIKILSSMRLDERRKPQDGRFSATFDGRRIDFRVSVLPTNAGEKVVLRILDSTKGVHTLDETGISVHNLEVMKRLVHEPYGMILVSGPTGSGKSTTLYSLLGEVDRETNNVLSLEDPVEYNIAGVAQSQMRPDIGYTFAAGLRAALRQDPDIILVGEIRDRETAQLAIQAALTGHLVFSTLHTNTAIGVVPRLIDMGIDPYLISPTLRLVIGQRLSRRICPDTGKKIPITGTIRDMVDDAFAELPKEHRSVIPEADTMLGLEPTEECPSGTRGRVAVTECLAVTPDIQALILENASEEKIYQTARQGGFTTMREDALIKALRHEIPFEEVGAFGTKVGQEEDLDAVVDETTPSANDQADQTPNASAVDNLASTAPSTV